MDLMCFVNRGIELNTKMHRHCAAIMPIEAIAEAMENTVEEALEVIHPPMPRRL